MMNITKKVKKFMGFSNDVFDENNTIWWISLLLILSFAWITFYYYDISCVVDNSVILLRSIIHGEFLNFYDFSLDKFQTSWAPNYEILMYLIFAIWSIPLALLNYFTDYDYIHGFFAILWTKLFIVICVIIVVKLIYLISMQVESNRKKARLAQLIFLSSINLLVPVIMISQCEIVSLVFILGGIYFYLKNDEKKFIIFFAIAIPLKMFAFFVFVPLVLLKEKRMVFDVIKTICGMSGLVLCKILFGHSVAYNFLTKSNSSTFIQSFQENGLQIGLGNVCLFVLVMICVCIYCYAREYDSEIVVYISFAIFSLFFMTVAFQPYWFALIVPFCALSISRSFINIKLKLVLESIFALFGFLYCSYTFYWVYGQDAFRDLWLSKTNYFSLYQMKYANISSILCDLGVDKYSGIIYTVFWGCLLALLILCLPMLKLQKGKDSKIEKSVFWFRLSCQVIVVFMWLTVGLVPSDTIVVDTSSDSGTVSDYNILSEKTSVEQHFSVQDDCVVKEIDLKLYNDATSRINISSLVFELYDENTEDVIMKKEMGTSIVSEEICRIKEEFKLNKSHKYVLKIYGKNGNGLRVSPYISSVDLGKPLYIDSKEVDGSLWMKLLCK